MNTVGLLMGLIRIPSNGFAEIHRAGNNLWVESGPQDERPAILLNAHIDTVKPSPGYTRDPFEPALEGDVLYGLGSNDDGGSLVALMETYSLLLSKPQPYRLVISATAEEEVCGKGGFDVFLQRAGKIDFGIIGEPTAMNMAVAEKGLMVLDCTAHGVSGHAARNEGKNAIYEALPSIEWFRTHVFPKVSEYLGSVKMTVTQITAGTQHNVIPDRCDFVVDVRSNGLYSNPDLLKLIKASVRCDVKERSTRIGSSNIPMTHPVVKRGLELGLKPFGSPTTSNQALASFPTLKIGPGDSSRSHTANEYIHISEIRDAVETYYRLLDGLEI